jgi:hypothetical protein
MNSERMMERKHLLPRPFRALPEATMRGGSCDPGLVAARLRPGLTPGGPSDPMQYDTLRWIRCKRPFFAKATKGKPLVGAACGEGVGFASRRCQPPGNLAQASPSPFALRATEDTSLSELRRTRGAPGLYSAALSGLVWARGGVVEKTAIPARKRRVPSITDRRQSALTEWHSCLSYSHTSL